MKRNNTFSRPRCAYVFVEESGRRRARFGTSCRAWPLLGREYCAAHDPEHGRAVAEQRRFRQAAEEELRARLREEHRAVRETLIRQIQTEAAERYARQAARKQTVIQQIRSESAPQHRDRGPLDTPDEVPIAIRAAKRRAEQTDRGRVRVSVDLEPSDVLALYDWFETRGRGSGRPRAERPANEPSRPAGSFGTR